MSDTIKTALLFLATASALPYLERQSPVDNKIICEPANDIVPQPVVEPQPITIVEPEPIITPVVRHAEIEIFTGPNCVWCDRAKADTPGRERVGWVVMERPAQTGRAIPYYRVWIDGKSYEHSGYMSNNALRGILQRAKRVATQPVSVVRSVVRGTVSRVTPNYQARWTFPSPLDQHLQGWPHNMNPTGMTRAEMLSAHDSHHDRIGPISAAQLRAGNFAASSCPSGSCPTQRRGLFGWRR